MPVSSAEAYWTTESLKASPNLRHGYYTTMHLSCGLDPAIERVVRATACAASRRAVAFNEIRLRRGIADILAGASSSYSTLSTWDDPKGKTKNAAPSAGRR
jgi:hypothetical protein